MCGICGVLELSGQSVSAQMIAKMNETIRHRGPDGDGVWVEGPIGLGNRRLAIIDLSLSGHQPMSNETGDVIIVYNGELYNYQSLRIELEAAGHCFHSRSDTETIVHAYEEWGTACLERFNGMFAFAIWDKSNQQLFLARDRFGVKPLYYYCDKEKFVFGSEIKAILAYPGIPRKICFPALNEYFTFQNGLTDLTLFDGIRLLPHGHSMTLKPAGHLVQRQYWDFPIGRERSPQSPEEDTAEELYHLFTQAVTRQLVSDVPIASYLSGGMDSGSITAVARQHLGRLMTFTGGFDLSSASGMELGFDERANSEMLANRFKTEHYEMVLHAGDMENIMPELIWHLEDLRVGQCYPNYYIARLAGKFVKVVLSGTGGDELFGGYPWRYYRGLNSHGAGDYYRNYYEFWQRLVPDEDKPALFNSATYQQISGHSTFDVFRNVFGQSNPVLKTSADFVDASLYFEAKTFLQGLLVVEDKISMAHSLETRVPFLDNDLVDFASRLPPQYKLRDLDRIAQPVNENEAGKRLLYRTQDGKLILRRAMQRLIPPEVTERVKQGFSAPDASWFRGESIDYVNGLLRNPSARIYEYLNPVYISQRLDEHTSGTRNQRLFIWSLLSFEWWLRKFLI
ncbi:MAG: asparagine synthase (glutamine-hydrolyzing) [Chloroflexi bacterium]|nr:asparagine synthase (glutamine-hydrolyzing) [Chloroflexota bacterium]